MRCYRVGSRGSRLLYRGSTDVSRSPGHAVSKEKAPGSELRVKPKGCVNKSAGGRDKSPLVLSLKSAVTPISH